MTCKDCKNFEECLNVAETNETVRGRMHNISFWETSDEACQRFSPLEEQNV